MRPRWESPGVMCIGAVTKNKPQQAMPTATRKLAKAIARRVRAEISLMA
jgi:hypothetical protein